jgi:hypothetical protein
MQREHAREIEEMDAEAEKIAEDHARQLSALQTKLQEMTIRHTDELSALKHSHEQSAVQAKRAFKDREHALELQHHQHTRDLRKSVGDLNEALLSNDDERYYGSLFVLSGLPQHPDGQIRDQFLEIQQMVEDLGRLAWMDERKVWSEQLIKKLAPKTGPRLVKKAIVQDAVWTLLFHYIFCSPFRVFGEPGTRLEKEWTEQCGKG